MGFLRLLFIICFYSSVLSAGFLKKGSRRSSDATRKDLIKACLQEPDPQKFKKLIGAKGFHEHYGYSAQKIIMSVNDQKKGLDLLKILVDKAGTVDDLDKKVHEYAGQHLSCIAASYNRYIIQGWLFEQQLTSSE